MAGAERLFDRYVVVDWSAAAVPRTGADSVWIAALDADVRAASATDVPMVNPPTRRTAEAELGRLTSDPTRRTLVAIDAPLGYPDGSAAWFGLDGPSGWRSMWQAISELVADDAANRNNRFEVAAALNRRGSPPGPFWGAPARRAIDGLAHTRPTHWDVPELRRVDDVLRRRGFRPASCWQLLGAGSVGSQTLTLLPVLARLMRRGGWHVWPMTTGYLEPRLGPGETAVAETWPTVFGAEVMPTWMVRDAAQVTAVALALRDADERNELASWFAPPTGGATSDEGWVLAPPHVFAD